MSEAPLSPILFSPAFDEHAMPPGTYELEVDGIRSFRAVDGVYVRPFYSILGDGHDGPCPFHECVSDGYARLRCSRPYTPDDERRWLAGERHEDLDAWDDY